MKKLNTLVIAAFALAGSVAFAAETPSCDVNPGILNFIGISQLSVLVCSNGNAAYYPNGAYAGVRGSAWYHPNGSYAGTKGSAWYHIGGSYAGTEGSAWYHPNGTYAGSNGSAWYYENGSYAGTLF